MTRERASLLEGIYAVVNESSRAQEIAEAVLRAGVRFFQYRAKSGINVRQLHALLELVHAADGLLVLDDDWRAARDHGCDGVHLGPADDGFADLSPVRAAFENGVIGLSCGSEAEMRHAQRSGADYAGVGPVFATTTKCDAGEPIGVAGLRRIAGAAPLKVAAIGGISPENVAGVKASGVAMACAIGAFEAADPFATARALVKAWNVKR